MDQIFRLLCLCILLNHDLALGNGVVIDIARVSEAPIFMEISDTRLSPKPVDRKTSKFGRSTCSEIGGSFLEARVSITLGIWHGNNFFPISAQFGKGFQASGIFARCFFMAKPFMDMGSASLKVLPALGATVCLANENHFGFCGFATGLLGFSLMDIMPHFAAFEFTELKCQVAEEILHPEFLAEVNAKDAIISRDSHAIQRHKKSIQDLSSELCPICLENFLGKNNIFHTPCNHDFHTYCLARWVKQKHLSCPYCKSSLKFSDLLFIEVD